MKNINKKNNKKNNYLFYKLLSFLMFLVSTYLIIDIIKTDVLKHFHIVLISIILILICLFISWIINIKPLRKCIKNFFSIIGIILIILEIIFILYGVKSLKFLSNLTDTGYRVETYGVYVLKNNEYDNVENLNNKNIFYLKSNDEMINKVLKKLDKKIDYETDGINNIDKLINNMINNKCDSVIFPISYENVLKEEFYELYESIKLIEEIDVVEYVKTIDSNVDITKDNFVVYISGIDTSGNILSKSRSDVNLLMFVNQKDNKILLVNTPRDYYVYLPSYKSYDKLTHSGLYGIDESVKVFNNLYNVNIDYYLRINFTSFIKVIDAIDGIEVNVNKSFCEQDSKRSFKESDLICLEKGLQKLNGEQALAYARHRKSYALGDRTRGQNQMEILSAILDKLSGSTILKNYNNLLNSLDGKIMTNMTSNEIFKFVKKQMSDKTNYEIESISLTGDDSSEVCYSTGSGRHYVMKENTKVLTEVKEKINEIYGNLD